jgi:protein-disulfide isomerase
LAALPSHEAARCANERGKFWADYDKLFAGLTNSNLDIFKGFAKDVRPDVAAFEKCFDSEKYQAAVEKDIEEGKRVGMTGTPAFFVNGRLLSDAQRSTLLHASSTTN